MNTKQRVSAQRGEHLAVWLSKSRLAIEFRCRRTFRGRKIATNKFGIREMSANGRPVWNSRLSRKQNPSIDVIYSR